MPSSDYGNAIGGGLKLKGAKDAGIDKKKKKKKSKVEPSHSEEPKSSEEKPGEDSAVQKALKQEEQDDSDVKELQDADVTAFGKTEAQRRHDERRRKRLDERLKREGVKTHKERVEELNKYLSGLSEHHDMPRIGPG